MPQKNSVARRKPFILPPAISLARTFTMQRADKWLVTCNHWRQPRQAYPCLAAISVGRAILVVWFRRWNSRTGESTVLDKPRVMADYSPERRYAAR